MKVQLKLRSNCKDAINLYSTFLKTIFNKMNYEYSHVGLPTRFKTVTLLKSPHVNKKAKNSYETRTYKQLFVIKDNIGLGGLNFVLMNRPKTVDVTMNTETR